MRYNSEKYLLLTGGAGFIGSALLRYLNEQGYYKIFIVDDLKSDERWKNLVGKRFLGIITPQDLFRWLEGREEEIGAFIHLGAESSTLERNAAYLLENNTHFSIRLAAYALKHSIRFIYASSAATYGDGSLGFSDEHSLLRSYRPLNMYGYSKHLFDLWLLEQGALDAVVGLKYFNIFGPNEYHKGNMSSAILRMVPDVQEKGAISLFKSNDPSRYAEGEQLRDFLYVKDAVAMTAQFLLNREGGIFNIGMGKAHTWNSLAKSVFEALGKVPQIHYIDFPAALTGKYQNFTEADMSKSERCALRMPQYTLESAVKEYITQYLLLNHYW